MNKMRPIFILGKHRSGTTWLANLIINHPYISAIKDKRHNGIHESAYFCFVRYYYKFNDLEIKNNYITFIESFSESDYFKLSNVDKDYFYKKDTRDNISTFKDFFEILMQKHALNENNNIWLEKSPTHTLFVEELSKKFNQVKFIAIKRNIYDVINSTEKRFNKNENELFYIIKQTFHYVGYNKIIENFKIKNPENIIVIDYEDMIYDKKLVLKNICEYLDLNYTNSLLNENYKKNTSYSKNEKKQMSYFKKYIIKIFSFFYNLIPAKFFSYLYKLKYKFFTDELPNWFYSNKIFNKSIEDD